MKWLETTQRRRLKGLYQKNKKKYEACQKKYLYQQVSLMQQNIFFIK